MGIKVCVIFISLVVGVNCTQRNVLFAKDAALSGFTCPAAEQIVILTQTIEMCTSVCASTDGSKSVFHTRSGCVICRSRYRKVSDARLLPMAGSVSYTTVVRCNPGWLSLLDSCYLWNSSTKMTFDQTNDYCSSLGAHVLSIDSDEEQDVASNVLQEMARSIEQVWIGIHLKDGSWSDKLVVNFYWALDEPNNQDNMEHYAITDVRFEWQRLDVPCTPQICAVCEIDMSLKLYIQFYLQCA